MFISRQESYLVTKLLKWYSIFLMIAAFIDQTNVRKVTILCKCNEISVKEIESGTYIRVNS